LTALGTVEARNSSETGRLRRQVEVMLAYVLDQGLTPAPQAWMFEAVREKNAVVDLGGMAGAEGWNPAGMTAAEGWHPGTVSDAERLMTTEALVRAHKELSRIVAPARPATLELLHSYREGRRPGRVTQIPRQKNGQLGPGVPPGTASSNGAGPKPAGSPRRPRHSLFGLAGSTVPLVRVLILASVVFLAGFVLLAAVPDARAASAGVGLASGLSHLNFEKLLLRELFLLVAAALGACLTALYRASKDVSKGSYDPEFDHVFLQRILLGMATGLILAEVLPFRTSSTAGSVALSLSLLRPAIALLGGFSAGVVHGVLSRVVAALETLFGGAAREDKEEIHRDQLQKRADEVQAQADRATLNKLLEIRRIASSGAATRSIIEEIDRMITLVGPN
jgi:hypothetical protein